MSAHRPAAEIIDDMVAHERPISEQYRIIASMWVRLDGAARMLEEMKTTELEKRKAAVIAIKGEMPDSKAERIVKSDPDWESYIRAMVEARTAANEVKEELKTIEIREWEQRDHNSTIRAEMRLSR